jgi:hypothetical protein
MLGVCVMMFVCTTFRFTSLDNVPPIKLELFVIFFIFLSGIPPFPLFFAFFRPLLLLVANECRSGRWEEFLLFTARLGIDGFLRSEIWSLDLGLIGP